LHASVFYLHQVFGKGDRTEAGARPATEEIPNESPYFLNPLKTYYYGKIKRYPSN
jgi:hypothetical protein